MLDPKDSLAYTNKAAALIGLNRYQEALDAADQAIALDQDSYWGWYHAASALVALDRYSDLLEACKRLADLDPRLRNRWQSKNPRIAKIKRYVLAWIISAGFANALRRRNKQQPNANSES